MSSLDSTALDCSVPTYTSDVVLADALVRRKMYNFILPKKKPFFGSQYPVSIKYNFENKTTGICPEVEHILPIPGTKNQAPIPLTK